MWNRGSISLAARADSRVKDHCGFGKRGRRPFTQIVRPALKFCDYCVVNEFEAERTTGIEIVREGRIDLDAACKAAQELLAAVK